MLIFARTAEQDNEVQPILERPPITRRHSFLGGIDHPFQPDPTTPSSILHLLQNNEVWAEESTKDNPDFFRNLSVAQSPDYLWIGCADSRVPAK